MARSGFDFKSLHGRFVVDELALRQGFSWSFGFPRQYHSTIAPYSSSSKCYSYQEGKELKPGDLPKNNALSLIWGALDRKILSLLSDFQGLKVCSTVTYSRECS